MQKLFFSALFIGWGIKIIAVLAWSYLTALKQD